MTLGVALSLSATAAYSDSLSNSLNGMLGHKDASGMVNLDSINLNGKPKRRQTVKHVFKGRSGKAVIGHYNDGKVVRKREADKYIRKVTKGKIKDLDMLPKKQRLLVLNDLQKIYAMKHFKHRSPTAVVATINDKEILKKEADLFLKKVTDGKVKDFDRLDKTQQMALVEDLARPIVILDAIENDIFPEEKENIFKQAWLEKQRGVINVTADEMLKLYEKKKAQSLAVNPQAQIPPYISLGNRLKNEIFEQKVMFNIMKDVNITIDYDSNELLEKLDKILPIKEIK